MPQTGHWLCFLFLFLCFTLHLTPTLAYTLNDCCTVIVHSKNVTSGVSVDCQRCQLVSVPEDIPRNIIAFRLNYNHIPKINKTDFYHLSNLRELDLHLNEITHVENGAFVHLLELEILCMDDNHLTQLPDHLFQGLSNLLVLSLDSNNIQSINPAAFQFVPRLQELRLTCNTITGIIAIFQLSRLQVLNITSDELMSFQSKDLPLNMSSELRQFSVDSALIKTFSITTAMFPHLETINLTNSCGKEWDVPDKYFLRNITKVHFGDSYGQMYFNNIRKSLQSLDSLEYLQLTLNNEWINKDLLDIACNISTLRTLDLEYGDFINLKLLKHLHVEFTFMNEWGFEGLDEHETLSITYSELPMPPHSLQSSSPSLDVPLLKKGLDELETLSITYSELTILPHSLQSSSPSLDLLLLKSLRNFKIQFTSQIFPEDKFRFINKMLKHMKHLEHFTAVNADSSLIQNSSSLPDNDTFNPVPQLKTLALKSSNIPYLYPEMFYPIPKLEVLDLSNNKLTSLDFLAQVNLTRLIWLDLSLNQLTVINVSVFSFLPALRYVYMADNPFSCDCSNYDFMQWILYNKQTQIVFAHSYTCAFPLAEKGTRFLHFDYHSCEQMDTSFICYISNTCVIVLILLTSFTYHFLRLHLLYAYYLFLAFLYDAKERKRGTPQRYDAFISYNVNDELWVCREMLPVLEGEQGWRLCLHHRDFLPGKAIIENITDAIYGSRKTICVISRHYLDSEWCSREFQMASYRLFDEQKDVLILVFLEDIPAQQLSPHYQMRRLMKKHTYLSWTQAGQHPGLFWQNLRRALDAPDTDPDLNQ